MNMRGLQIQELQQGWKLKQYYQHTKRFSSDDHNIGSLKVITSVPILSRSIVDVPPFTSGTIYKNS